jgi:tRNA threonylcarbamoyladenosine biosynthesis protein TsaB
LALILNLETATAICSVALVLDGKILGLRESAQEKSHASSLTPFIADVLGEQSLKVDDLDAIAVSKGPGSYTGLRIGVSTAKGLAYASDKPLISIDTLSSLSAGAVDHPSVNDIIAKKNQPLLCPMIDARRMEVYTALYNTDGKIIEQVNAKIIDSDSYNKSLDKSNIIFFGTGSGKCRDIIHHPNAIFIEGIECSAAYMSQLSEKSFQEKKFENVAYFEPLYLKDFIATIPKNKIIG